MATRLKVDASALNEFEQQLKQLDAGAMQRFTEQMVRELAEIALAKIIERTPVGIYDQPVHFVTADKKEVTFTPHTGKQGGTLRRGWDIGGVTKKGDLYEVELTNSTDYASYVEYGHRKVNSTGWVPGRFMMTISEKELEAQGPAIIERRLTAFLKEALNGK
ncbi:HK97 gp10 family phage protein [Anaerocolumna jejuensis]|uniref:HK97 gp10 family phage protein n=1 Tax=Anaerocolumna jejuensis TaxID=259063 RepID=UPI003F7BE33A